MLRCTRGKSLYKIKIPNMQKIQLPITLDSYQICTKQEHKMSTKSTAVANEENKPARRKFFIGAGATVGAVAVASQTSIGKAVIQEIGSTVQGKDDGYQLSAHIRKYYETTML
jgi:hypothetical protein